MRVRRFLDPNISSCRWPSISFPVVTSFGDCSHAYRSDVHHRSVEAVTFIDQAEFRLLVLRATLLVTSYFLTITYDRAGFTYKTLTNHMYFPHRGAYAPYAPCMSTPLCFRVLQQSANLRKESKGTIIRPYTMYLSLGTVSLLRMDYPQKVADLIWDSPPIHRYPICPHLLVVLIAAATSSLELQLYSSVI